jgi:hypothetical protein
LAAYSLHVRARLRDSASILPNYTPGLRIDRWMWQYGPVHVLERHGGRPFDRIGAPVACERLRMGRQHDVVVHVYSARFGGPLRRGRRLGDARADKPGAHGGGNAAGKKVASIQPRAGRRRGRPATAAPRHQPAPPGQPVHRASPMVIFCSR